MSTSDFIKRVLKEEITIQPWQESLIKAMVASKNPIPNFRQRADKSILHNFNVLRDLMNMKEGSTYVIFTVGEKRVFKLEKIEPTIIEGD